MERLKKGNNVITEMPRGWEALEIMLKSRGLSSTEIEGARKSFHDGIEVLSKMFLVCYDTERQDDRLNK